MQTRSGVVPLEVASVRAYWMVGRGLCMYRCERFDHVPRNRRQAAMALNIPVWSPFARTGHHCVWADAKAMVWLWDADEVRPPTDEDAAPRVVPEAVFYPRKADGIHVQQCQHGYDLQYWQNDVLEDSYWQAEAPDQERLAWFGSRFEGAAMASEAATPGQLGATPWASPQTALQWLAANERAAGLACITLLAVLAIWHEARLWKTESLLANAQADFDQLATDLSPIVDARGEIIRLNNRGRTLVSVLNRPSQAYLMGLVDEALPASAKLRRWRYQQGELRILVEDPRLDPVAYVDALESRFPSVSVGASQQPNTIEISLQVES